MLPTSHLLREPFGNSNYRHTSEAVHLENEGGRTGDGGHITGRNAWDPKNGKYFVGFTQVVFWCEQILVKQWISVIFLEQMIDNSGRDFMDVVFFVDVFMAVVSFCLQIMTSLLQNIRSWTIRKNLPMFIRIEAFPKGIFRTIQVQNFKMACTLVYSTSFWFQLCSIKFSDFMYRCGTRKRSSNPNHPKKSLKNRSHRCHGSPTKTSVSNTHIPCHGNGIFTYIKTIKNQPSMSVNIPSISIHWWYMLCFFWLHRNLGGLLGLVPMGFSIGKKTR